MNNEPKYYAVGEKEYLTATSIDEAVEEFLDDVWTDNSPGDLSKTVRVIGFAPKCISEDAPLFDRMIEGMIECLDDDFGGPDGQSDYELSDEAKQLFDALKAKVIDEYPVWQCEQVGEPVEVDLTPYINAAMRNM